MCPVFIKLLSQWNWIIKQFLPSVTEFGPRNFGFRLKKLWNSLNRMFDPFLYIVQQFLPSLTKFGPSNFSERLKIISGINSINEKSAKPYNENIVR